MGVRYALVLLLVFSSQAVRGDVITYEGDAFPEQVGWIPEQILCEPELWLDAGWFYQHVELCEGHEPPGGQMAVYRRSLADFQGAPRFFVEWRVQSDAPRSEIPWGGGAAISFGGFSGVNYAFFVANDQMKLNRGNNLPIVFVDIEPGVPHEYWLGLYGTDQYVLMIDGEIVDSGVPRGAFPSESTDSIVWRARAAWVSNTTRWDYIRYGTIPPGNTGDVNCDGRINNFDIDPFVLALSDPAAYEVAHPACDITTADIDGDGLVNNFDIDPFVVCLTSGCP